MPNSWHFLAGFASSFLLCVAFTEALKRVAPAAGLLDRPGGRHQHERPIPTVGGIAIFGSITACFVLFALWPGRALAHATDPLQFFTILGGGAAFHMLGVADDRWRVEPHVKLAVQATIAVAVFFGGIRLAAVQFPGFGLLEFPEPVSLLLTILWIVGVANALNLVDGTDGVAGGVALWACLPLFVVSLLFEHQVAALLLALAAGALVGFLRSNFPPASVFLGDGGSLYVGFLLASLGLASSTKAATVVAIAIPIMALGFPVLDTTLATGRRLIVGRAITSPDRGHIHHRLIDHGLSPKQVAILLCGVSGVFALGSMLLAVENARLAAFVLIVVGVTVGLGIHRLRVPELLELRSAIDRGLSQRQVMSKNLAIRTSTARVARASSVAETLAELSDLLAAAAVDDAEMWLDGEFGWVRDPVEGMEAEEVGATWRWERRGPDDIGAGPCWEVRLPLIGSEGTSVGQLTLRRPVGSDMPPDLLLLLRRFLPEMLSALERTGGADDRADGQPPATPGAHEVPLEAARQPTAGRGEQRPIRTE